MPNQIEYLTINETNALLRVIDHPRDQAVVALFLNTGLFLQEAVGLKTDWIKWESKILSVKGKRPREIPLNDQAFEALARWSKERVDSQVSAFFTTSRGALNALSLRSINQLIPKYAKQAGIKKRVNSQTLRNTFAVRLFSQEVSIAKAAAILGITDHESINRYILASKQSPIVKVLNEDLTKVDTRPRLAKLVTKYFPTTPKIAQLVNSRKEHILPEHEELVFGRERVIDDVRLLLAKKQPILLIGPLGIGKTHLLKHLTRLFSPNPLYLASPKPLKSMLGQICDKVGPDWRKQLKAGYSAREMIDFIIRSYSTQDPAPILIIDNLDDLRSSDTDLFISLFEHCTILAATSALKPKLEQVWWKFKQIRLNPLNEGSAKQLIKYLTQNLAISDYEMLETRILTVSNRLPLAMVDMISQISHKPVITKEVVRDIYHEAGTRYRDWTPLLIIIWGAAMLFRFVALGTHSFEGYILAGALIASLMTVIRFMKMVK
ncbi:MAG: tyrosine-type recombinase/integrase [Candidatus Margulisiibacteriota bacterium]